MGEKTVRESQSTIFEWAEATFGPARSIVRLLGRANTEMAELIRAVTTPGSPAQIAEEAADTAIVLCCVATMAAATISFEGGAPAASNPLQPAASANATIAELLAELVGRPRPIRTVTVLLRRAFLYLESVCEACGTTLTAEIDKKMATNRQRRWVREGGGVGSHTDGADEHHIRIEGEAA